MDTRQRRTITFLLIISFIFGFFFLRHYISLIALSAIVAFLFNPIYKKLLKTFKGRAGWAAMVTFLISVITIAIPIIVIMVITVDQALQIAENIRLNTTGDLINSIVKSINNLLDKFSGHSIQHIDSGQIINWLKDHTSTILKSVTSFIVSFAGGISSIITKTVIYVFIFISFLKNQDKLVEIIHKLNPLQPSITDLYLGKMKAMTKAMVKGQFTIAMMQGLVDAALLFIVGYKYFVFWFVLITFLSIIPLGGGIIVLPVGIVMLLTGHIWQGILLIVGHLIIVTNIDNVIRPRFVPKEASLDSALTILSVFAGIAMFGFLGIVIGPVLMILIVTTIQVYIDEMHPKDKAKDEKELKKLEELL